MYYCCLVETAVNQNKVAGFLKDLHRTVADNFEPAEFDKKTSINEDLADTCTRTLDNYNLKPFDKKTGTGGPVVNFSNVRLADKKVSELKVGLIKSVEGMSRNIESAEQLELTSKNLRDEADVFK
uniref:Uncharacterized protein n=1 Tax=Euplotes harpa TaxID=151035 RepID=A0A7S3JKJ5_9SPIT|mmetsp:Transcript_6425/g.7389  ORF Transcript_6425/g.7389 Transcript_6425/m.7389 type:complete len:125 (+) Transcript_6425:335-709(+)